MEHITKAIEAYIKKNNTNYAVMINGDWGSGKTYLWENNLKQMIENIDVVAGEKEKYRTTYISLYGLQSMEEISKKIFLDKIIKKYKDNKNSKKVSELGKIVFSSIQNIEIYGLKIPDITNIDYSEFLDFTDVVLCFDDLERSNLDLHSVMGYISNLVEHDSAKVIILCNEKEITTTIYSKDQEIKTLASVYLAYKSGKLQQFEGRNNLDEELQVKDIIEELKKKYFDKSNNYNSIKEKLIGLTLLYNPNNEERLQTLIGRITNVNVKQYLLENINSINSIILKSNISNLRIIQYFFFDFENIYYKIESTYPELLSNNILFNHIIVCLLTISLEVKTGKEEVRYLGGVKTEFPLDWGSMQAPSEENNYNIYISNFLDRYFNNDEKQNYKYFKFVYLLVKNGYINANLFNQEVSYYQEQLDTRKSMSISFIQGDYLILSNEEFLLQHKRVYQELKEGNIPLKYYFKAYVLFKKLITSKIIDIEPLKLLSDIKEGVNIVMNNKNVSLFIDNFHFRNGKINNEDESELMIYIKDKVHEKHVKKEYEKSQSVLELFENNFDDFCEKFESYSMGKYFFQYLDPIILANITIKLTNKQLYDFFLLIKSYSSDLTFSKPQQKDVVEIYISTLKGHVNTTSPKLSDFNINNIISILERNYELDS